MLGFMAWHSRAVGHVGVYGMAQQGTERRAMLELSFVSVLWAREPGAASREFRKPAAGPQPEPAP